MTYGPPNRGRLARLQERQTRNLRGPLALCYGRSYRRMSGISAVAGIVLRVVSAIKKWGLGRSIQRRAPQRQVEYYIRRRDRKCERLSRVRHWRIDLMQVRSGEVRDPTS